MKTTLLLLTLSALPAAAAAPSILSLAANAARRGSDCAKKMALESYQSLPLPVLGGKGLRYGMMVYDAVGEGPADPDLKVRAPYAVVEFDANGGQATCGVSVAFPKPHR